MKGCEKSGQSLLDAAMANTMTVKEAAMLWGVTERWVTVLCKEGRIEGAYKKDRSWSIPANAKKPADSRIKTGAYRKTLNECRWEFQIIVWPHPSTIMLIKP